MGRLHDSHHVWSVADLDLLQRDAQEPVPIRIVQVRLMQIALFVTNLHSSQRGVEAIATNGGDENPPSLWFVLPPDWVAECKIGTKLIVNIDLGN